MLRAHTWETEYVDAGMLDGDFWKCPTCGASGGPVHEGHSPPTLGPFYADGSGLQVSANCDEAKSQIQEHLKTWVPWDKRPVEPPSGVKVGPATPRVLSKEESVHIHEMAVLGYQLWGHKYGHLDETQMADFEEHCKTMAVVRDAAQVSEQTRVVAANEAWLSWLAARD